MKRVCAWCGERLDQSTAATELVTHGVCPGCRRIAFPTSRRKDPAVRVVTPVGAENEEAPEGAVPDKSPEEGLR